MKEGKIEEKLVRYCRKVRVLCYKFNSPSRAGVPDRILVFPKGHVVFLELKATGQKPTPLQRRELDLLAKQYAIAMWSDSFEWCRDFIDKKLRDPDYVAPAMNNTYRDFI